MIGAGDDKCGPQVSASVEILGRLEFVSTTATMELSVWNVMRVQPVFGNLLQLRLAEMVTLVFNPELPDACPEHAKRPRSMDRVEEIFARSSDGPMLGKALHDVPFVDIVAIRQPQEPIRLQGLANFGQHVSLPLREFVKIDVVLNELSIVIRDQDNFRCVPIEVRGPSFTGEIQRFHDRAQ